MWLCRERSTGRNLAIEDREPFFGSFSPVLTCQDWLSYLRAVLASPLNGVPDWRHGGLDPAGVSHSLSQGLGWSRWAWSHTDKDRGKPLGLDS